MKRIRTLAVESLESRQLLTTALTLNNAFFINAGEDSVKAISVSTTSGQLVPIDDFRLRSQRDFHWESFEIEPGNAAITYNQPRTGEWNSGVKFVGVDATDVSIIATLADGTQKAVDLVPQARPDDIDFILPDHVEILAASGLPDMDGDGVSELALVGIDYSEGIGNEWRLWLQFALSSEVDQGTDSLREIRTRYGLWEPRLGIPSIKADNAGIISHGMVDERPSFVQYSPFFEELVFHGGSQSIDLIGELRGIDFNSRKFSEPISFVVAGNALALDDLPATEPNMVGGKLDSISFSTSREASVFATPPGTTATIEIDATFTYELVGHRRAIHSLESGPFCGSSALSITCSIAEPLSEPRVDQNAVTVEIGLEAGHWGTWGIDVTLRREDGHIQPVTIQLLVPEPPKTTPRRDEFEVAVGTRTWLDVMANDDIERGSAEGAFAFVLPMSHPNTSEQVDAMRDERGCEFDDCTSIPFDASQAVSGESFAFNYTVVDAFGRLSSTSIVVNVVDAQPGDVTGDGAVDFADFLILSSEFGREDLEVLQADFDESGLVDFADFLVLSAQFGN